VHMADEEGAVVGPDEDGGSSTVACGGFCRRFLRCLLMAYHMGGMIQ
jgi:hypothetical protein